MPARNTRGFTLRFLSVFLKSLLSAALISSPALCQEGALIDQAASSPTAESSGGNLALILQSLKEIKNLSAPIGRNSAQPAMMFSCERILVERKKVGFFRIGILPQILLQNVKIKLWSSQTPSDWAEELASFLISKEITALEFRFLRIETKGCLDSVFAGKASLAHKGELLILQDVAIQFENQTIHQPRVVIPLRGPKSGEIVFPGKPNFRLTITSNEIEATKGFPP